MDWWSAFLAPKIPAWQSYREGGGICRLSPDPKLKHGATMRILAIVLLLGACSPQPPQPKPERVLYAGQGRERLCTDGKRAGFIVYGDGDGNCAATGRIERGSFIPAGDEDCKIPVRFE